jgi:general stress protein CsbA
VKIFIKTMMAVFVVLFCTLTFLHYVDDVRARAEASIPQKPDFEHTNNQQFLDNVLQCVDYVYWKNKDFEKVNIELLLAQAV